MGLLQSVASFDRANPDDLARVVFGVLGMPLDALDLKSLLQRIDLAVEVGAPFLLSTPNVNFLMMSRSDTEFRESLLMSDLCPVDGMPLVWIARLLGIPIRERLSGSDIFDALRARGAPSRKLKVFLFGGGEGVAETVSETLNREAGGMTCVGALNPGFGSIADMSAAPVFQVINASRADLLTVFLSARKAQAWLLRSHDHLQVPFRAQFGATINLQAGRVKRAPILFQKIGLEWLWRIKEEPYLWKRYWDDGLGLISLTLNCVLPLFAHYRWRKLTGSGSDQFKIHYTENPRSVLVSIAGAAIERHIDAAIDCFRKAIEGENDIEIDLSNLRVIDPRFFGLLLMVRKLSIRRGFQLQFSNATPRIKKMFRLNGFEYLLNAER